MDLHLNSDQIDELLQSTTGDNPTETTHRESLEDARRHLKDCASCQARIRAHEHAIESLALLKPTTPGAKGPICPPDDVWLEIAAGIVRQDSENHLSHAAQCDHCGPILRRTKEDFADEVAPAEEIRIADLGSSTPQWQESLSAKLSRTLDSDESKLSQHPSLSNTGSLRDADLKEPFRTKSRRTFLPQLRWAMAAIALAIVAIVVIYRRQVDTDPLNSVDRLIAQAYTEQRTLPLRISGAAYGPLKITRGGAGSRLDRPAALLEAEAKIAAMRGLRGRDFGWLVAGARADLLEGNYDAAIQSLQQALVLQPTATEAGLHLATAYFERARATGAGAGFSAAEESIDPVLERNPNNAIALFNRALIYEQMFSYSKAAEDWENYLKLDPKGEWSQEAREHLATVNRKLEEKRLEGSHAALLDPNALLQNQQDASANESIDSQIEEYQHIVFVQWLPDIVRQNRLPKPPQESSMQNAVQRVSLVSLSRHADRFLADLSAAEQSKDPRISEAINRLSSAISANQSGNEHLAFQLAEQARMGFAQAGIEPGILRAQFEQIYALQFSSDVKRCLLLSRSVAEKSHRYGYAWLEAESLIEEGFCANMDGDLALALSALQQAETVATRSRYEEAAERALLGEAAMQWQAGSQTKAWKYLLDDLQRYWEHPVSDVRGTSIYALLDFVAEESQLWHTQETALEESAVIARRGSDRLYLAHTLSRLAACELMLHRSDLAQRNLREAMDLFRAAPQTDSTRSQELLVSINVAKAELQSGDYQASLRHLRLIQPQVATLHEDLSLLDFYSTLGEACRKTGAWSEADSADHQAIALFRTGLTSLQDPRDGLAWYREGSPVYRSLVQLRLDEKDPGGALDIWESYRSEVANPPLSGKPHLLSTPAGIPEGTTELLSGPKPEGNPAVTILAYATLPDGLFGWARTGNHVEVARLSKTAQDVTNIANAFSNQCSNPSSNISDLRRNGYTLFRVLVAPLYTSSSKNTVFIIEPDEDLERIPFNALIDDQGRYLNASYEIAMAAGSNKPFYNIREESISGEDSILLAVASTAPGSGTAPDPLAEGEVLQIASLFKHPTILMQRSNSRVAFQTLLSRTSIFHYAGHSGTTARGGQLFLGTVGPNGADSGASFSSSDIDKRTLRHCRLVVLSACETDQGLNGRWFDRENLALTFVNAGVPEVVAARWKVDSQATSVIMKQFYGLLLHGATPAAALRTALEQTRLRAEFSHPYYWAGFSMLVNGLHQQ